MLEELGGHVEGICQFHVFLSIREGVYLFLRLPQNQPFEGSFDTSSVEHKTHMYYVKCNDLF